jgi:hypothetical protein
MIENGHVRNQQEGGRTMGGERPVGAVSSTRQGRHRSWVCTDKGQQEG